MCCSFDVLCYDLLILNAFCQNGESNDETQSNESTSIDEKDSSKNEEDLDIEENNIQGEIKTVCHNRRIIVMYPFILILIITRL